MALQATTPVAAAAAAAVFSTAEATATICEMQAGATAPVALDGHNPLVALSTRLARATCATARAMAAAAAASLLLPLLLPLLPLLPLLLALLKRLLLCIDCKLMLRPM